MIGTKFERDRRAGGVDTSERIDEQILNMSVPQILEEIDDMKRIYDRANR